MVDIGKVFDQFSYAPEMLFDAGLQRVERKLSCSVYLHVLDQISEVECLSPELICLLTTVAKNVGLLSSVFACLNQPLF